MTSLCSETMANFRHRAARPLLSLASLHMLRIHNCSTLFFNAIFALDQLTLFDLFLLTLHYKRLAFARLISTHSYALTRHNFYHILLLFALSFTFIMSSFRGAQCISFLFGSSGIGKSMVAFEAVIGQGNCYVKDCSSVNWLGYTDQQIIICDNWSGPDNFINEDCWSRWLDKYPCWVSDGIGGRRWLNTRLWVFTSPHSNWTTASFLWTDSLFRRFTGLFFFDWGTR